MFYVLLDNFDEGLELESFETVDALLSFFRDEDRGASNWRRAQYVIVGQELEWSEVKKAVDSGETRARA